ncbi:hypothetical protein BH10ACI1_BH10ACI1_33770 [soil metagenome]
MNDADFIEFDSAVRMIDFKTANPNVFRNNQKMTDGFTALEADVATLEAAGASRVSSKGLRSDGTADKRAAKTDLYALVRKIIETGKTIKKEEPDFDNKFKVRRGTLSGQEILDAGRAFAADLTAPTVAKFADYALAAANPTTLNAKIDAFETARAQQNTGKSGSVAATATTRAAIGRIKKTRRTVAKIGENIIEETNDAGLVAEWKSACRIERRAKKTTGTPTPPTPGKEWRVESEKWKTRLFVLSLFTFSFSLII